MAYAEKRGKGPAPWRVKYKLPNGTEISESGFETKAAALTWGRDQEARIREGRWTDPNAGKLTVGEWIDRWLAIQDVGISTVDHRDYLIRRFVRPAWGDTPLHSLSTEEITQWENGLPARTGVSPRTARAARTLLGTILGDAATTRPPLIPYNPALRPRNRGRRTGRRVQLSPQRAWATPLETLLLAERATLMTGRDEDFTMILTIGYTGLRWGEAIGLERNYTARLLAPDQAGPDRAWPQARAQDLDGRRRHPRDPRRTAPRPPGPRHARPLRPRLRPDARRPQARTPGPMGRLATRPRDHQPALTRPVARRAADSRGDPPESGDTRRQGEDDLPNSSQPPRQREAAQACDTGRTGINSV